VTTQPPTESELARARREGRSPLSELAVLAAVWTSVLATLPALGVALQRAVREALSQASREAVDPWRAASAIAGPVLAPLGVALGAAVLAAAMATLLQTRGARRSAEESGRSGEPGAWSVALATTAYGAVVLVVGATGWTTAGSLTALAARLGAALAALAAVDVGWRAWCWRRALATTAAERRQAQREDEGDPAVKRERSRRMR
jgi:flagellar biosynthesis protein FlhB